MGQEKLVGRVPIECAKQQTLTRLLYPPFDVVLIWTGERFFALEDACTHAGASLSEGWLEDGCIVCPMHAYAFDVQTGCLVQPRGLSRGVLPDQRRFVVREECDSVAVYDVATISIVR